MTNEAAILWEDLIISILSVNRYSLEKTFVAVETLRREGLFYPQNLGRWSPEEIGKRLQHGGYDRGKFMTDLFADRLAAFGKYVNTNGVEECERVLRKGEIDEVEQLLQPVKGIGPKVLANFFLLHPGARASV